MRLSFRWLVLAVLTCAPTVGLAADATASAELTVKGRLVWKGSREAVKRAQVFVSTFVDGGCRNFLVDAETNSIEMAKGETDGEGRFEVTVKRALLLSEELCFFMNHPPAGRLSATYLEYEPSDGPAGLLTVDVKTASDSGTINLEKLVGDIAVE